MQYANWVAAMLANGLGGYEEALVSAQLASDDTPERYVSGWAVVELVEAAARSGHTLLATEGVERLAVSTQPMGTDWALRIEGSRTAACIHDRAIGVRSRPLRRSAPGAVSSDSGDICVNGPADAASPGSNPLLDGVSVAPRSSDCATCSGLDFGLQVVAFRRSACRSAASTSLLLSRLSATEIGQA